MKVPLPLAAFLAFAIAGGPFAMAAEQARQCVVLRNGSVLEGEVHVLGDYYRVRTDVSEIRLPARDVERISGSLLEAYDAKRAELRSPQANDHLRLAVWCIRQEMWPQAARELNDARAMEPDHPGLLTFEHRLATAARAAERRALPVDPEPLDEKRAEEEESARELAELGAAASSLPAGTLEDYTRHIQPLLVNNCTLAGCHNMSDDRPFKLNRDLLHGIGNRRSTLRNLDATLRAIDPDNVDQSPLLLKAATAHGGMATPPFAGHRQKLYERLVDWTYDVTGTERAAVPAEVAPSESANDPQLPATEPGDPGVENYDQPAEQPGVPPAAASQPYFWEREAIGGPAEAEIKRGANVKRFTPRDEFDPEIFNRQHSSPAPQQPNQAGSRGQEVEFER